MWVKTLAAWLLLVPFTVSVVWAQSVSCESAFQQLSVKKRLARLSPRLPSLYDEIQMLPVDVISGKKTPQPYDFKSLVLLIDELRKVNKSLRAPEDQAEIESIVSQILMDPLEMFRNRFLADAHRSYTPKGEYRPAEYQLKVHYQFLLNKLNRELPKRIRIPLQRLPVDLGRSTVQLAREFMASFEKDFERRFSTTGHATFEEYERFIRSSKDPLVQKALEMIDKGQIEVVIRVPESARFWIPKTGFHNQYVTGSSRGVLINGERKRAEARLYNTYDAQSNPDAPKSNSFDYSSQSAEFMPKYATLRPSRDSGVVFERKDSDQFGSDFYVFKLPRIQDRLTWAKGDSLSLGRRSNSEIEYWDQTFVPWKYRLLMVNFMTQGLERNEFGNPNGGFLVNYHSLSTDYWETQILGAIDLQDIASFEFLGEPPSGQFLLALLDHGISIFDAREQPSKEWKPTEEDIRKAKDEL